MHSRTTILTRSVLTSPIVAKIRRIHFFFPGRRSRRLPVASFSPSYPEVAHLLGDLNPIWFPVFWFIYPGKVLYPREYPPEIPKKGKHVSSPPLGKRRALESKLDFHHSYPTLESCAAIPSFLTVRLLIIFPPNLVHHPQYCKIPPLLCRLSYYCDPFQPWSRTYITRL